MFGHKDTSFQPSANVISLYATRKSFDASSLKAPLTMKTTIAFRSSAFLIIVLILAIFTLQSCEKAEPLNKEPKKIVLNKKSAEIIQADRQFAFELFREVYGISQDDNLMISPLSTSYALGMTYNGSAGDTREAFRQVLHYGEWTDMEVNESYKDLMSQLVTLDDHVKFSIANSIWYRLGYEVLEAFIATNREYFDAVVEELDFSDPEAVNTINDWIEERTNGKISDMLDFIPSDAVMYLVNAIYFNATWKYQFDKEDTFEDDFTLEGGALHRCDFMKVEGSFNYTSQEYFTAVELPYGDSAFSMVVLLPNPGVTVAELVNEMNAENWNAWFEHSHFTEIPVVLPKFKYGFQSLLNEPLINLGLGIAFTESADFSNIKPESGIFISRVLHQTFIDVKEEGTEAAAATVVEMLDSTNGAPFFFRADRPFLYVIKENSTGAILFMGKVGKPEYGD
jgi:serpin B